MTGNAWTAAVPNNAIFKNLATSKISLDSKFRETHPSLLMRTPGSP